MQEDFDIAFISSQASDKDPSPPTRQRHTSTIQPNYCSNTIYSGACLGPDCSEFNKISSHIRLKYKLIYSARSGIEGEDEEDPQPEGAHPAQAGATAAAIHPSMLTGGGISSAWNNFLASRLPPLSGMYQVAQVDFNGTVTSEVCMLDLPLCGQPLCK